MSVNLRLKSEGFQHDTDLCTNHGYTLLGDWLESLSPEKYPACVELGVKGTFMNTEELANQLEAAFAANTPEDPEVEHTANRLLDLLGNGRPHESVMIY